MKGLELSRALFRDRAEKELKARFPELFGRLAFGLVGNGSECFGFDDEISRDHDWGADFYVWLLRGIALLYLCAAGGEGILCM